MNPPTTDTAAPCACACGESADVASETVGAAGVARRRVVQLGAAAVTGALTVGLLAACGSDDKDADGDDDGDKPAAQGSSPAASTGSGSGSGTVVAKLADVAVGSTAVVGTDGADPLVIYRSSDTAVTAFSAKCTHKFCPVKVGSDALDCPCHGSKFDLKTGARISGVATEPLPARAVAIKGDDIVLA